MSTDQLWGPAWTAACGVHAGFQLTVSCLVYPALAELPAELWVEAHQRHSRRIVPLVGGIYLAVSVTTAARLLTRPGRAALLAALANGAVLGTTALVAAPVHSRLDPARDPRLWTRLVRADHGRSVLTVVALAAAAIDVGSRGA